MNTMVFIGALGALTSAATAQCRWGGFDGTRVNYAGAVLFNGAEHSTLRGIIATGGGTVVAPTPTITAAYLSSVEVFYTSLLNTNTGVLSGSEQAALQSWVQGGGTLIVTADIFPLPAYASFTSWAGITNYVAVSQTGNATVITPHPLTAGVTAISYTTESTFTIPSTALALANGVGGQLFMAVMEPSTGHTTGGRILITGDHNMFANSRIGMADNTALAQNMAAWACTPPAPGCYPNCDGSTTAPILNVNDFVCFQQLFAAGASYANCDNSTTPPVLNVNDFVCFQQQFAAGCP